MMLWFIFIIIPASSSEIVRSFFDNDFEDDARHGSCGFRSVRQAEFNWDMPGRSMTESFVLDDVEYKICRYHVTWDEARVFCSTHKSHLATLDSDEKTAFVVRAIASTSSVAEDYWIGARKLFDEPWTWNTNEMRISFENNIIDRDPIWYPGYDTNDVHCLTIDRSGHDEPIFVPRACNQRRGFICQRDNDRAFDNKIRMVAALRIGEQEFRLYAGRATWAEAVVQCRQEGLQIAEVNTIEEARVLAISMLRNRPDGIESAWIGGYTRKDEPSAWRWLASGEKIIANDLWRKKNTSQTYGECLLLDRHVCETPIYVASNCDRKRDVLCQKPPKKRLSKTPIPVIIDGCLYRIGFHPSKWSDARRSCESLNSSLIVLDSSTIISHMMRIMLDNKAELRHIWTDGHRSKISGQWQWSVNGEPIPNHVKTFIPWCPDNDYHTMDTGCLNLDRENLDSPIVYGLSCREKQTYVCQPLVGDCVFHTTSKMPVDAVSDASEDIHEQTTLDSSLLLYEDTTSLPVSTITAPYLTDRHNHDILQTDLPDPDDHLDDYYARKSNDRGSSNTSASSNDFSQYFDKFTRFALPRLPEFGIKVVSATETITNNPDNDVKMKKNKFTSYKFFTTDSYVPTTTIASPSSSLSTVGKKHHNDVRKSSKLSNKSVDPSIKLKTIDFDGVTISSIGSSTVKSRKIGNSTRPASNRSTSGSKSITGTKRSSKITRPATTMTPTTAEDFPSRRTIKHSTKTTRDLNYSNVTKISSTMATKVQESSATTTIEKDSKSETTENRQNFSSNLPTVDKPVTKIGRSNTSLVSIRRQNHRVSTEPTTPYDAIDEDYYNDDKNDYSDKTNIDDSDESDESDEYFDDYESTTSFPSTSRTKKKSKQTSTTSIRRNHTTTWLKTSKQNGDEDDNPNEEFTTPASIPMAEQLSNNMKNAFLNMMQRGIEKKLKNSTSTNQSKSDDERRSSKTDNAPWIKETMSNVEALKFNRVENFSIRPYYAFEGPIIMNLAPKFGGPIERTGDYEREYKFIGKKMTDASLPNYDKKLEKNETTTRRPTINEQSNRRNYGNNGGRSYEPAMPTIRTNDPGSLLQLGRYFKNTFANVGRNYDGREEDRRPLTTRPRNEEVMVNDRGRYGPPGRAYSQDRSRGHPSANGDEDERSKIRGWEKSGRSGIRDSNYYEGPRRLYPRGNYDIRGVPARDEENKMADDENKMAERLKITWPLRNTSNYEIFDDPMDSVTPRSFAIPIRTTRSFHDDHKMAENHRDHDKRSSMPNFRLSKLVKEVKIDLDRKMLRRYVEGFARQIVTKNTNDNGDWKSNWRQLLRQIMMILDRMNVNVNGDVMKLKFDDDDDVEEGENELSSLVGNSRKIRWKSSMRKQRKDSVIVGNVNLSNGTKITNVTSTKNIQNGVVDAGQGGRGSLDDLRSKNSEKEHFDHSNNANDGKMENKISLGREETIDDLRGNHRQSPSKSLQQKWTNFSDPQISRVRQSIVPVARLSTVFGYRPLMPQLHHRIIFQPGWNSIRTNLENKKPKIDGEYLPKGTLSRIVGSRHKNEHFGVDDVENKFVNSSKTEKVDGAMKKSFDGDVNFKFNNERLIHEDDKQVHSAGAGMRGTDFEGDSRMMNAKKFDGNNVNRLGRVFGMNNKSNERWRGEENERNGFGNDYYDGYHNESRVNELDGGRNNENYERINENYGRINENYGRINENYGKTNENYGKSTENNGQTNKNDERIDKNDEKNNPNAHEEIPNDKKMNPSSDYDRKPIWSSAHRLGKALELSVLRKFGTSPSNYLTSKNLVTRSATNTQNIKNENIDPAKVFRILNDNTFSNREKQTEDNVKNLDDDEGSIVSLRMIMNPDVQSPRISRQSRDSKISNVDPQTVNVRLEFSKNSKTPKMEENTLNVSKSDDHDSNTKAKDANYPTRLTNEKNRRAMFDRFGQQNSDSKKNDVRSRATFDRNATEMDDHRDRRSRNIGSTNENSLGEEKSSGDISETSHYVATSLRSSDNNGLGNGRQNKWAKGARSHERDSGIDWKQQASALFADLKESNDDLTLYIDLTLGRVGSKPRNGGRSRG